MQGELKQLSAAFYRLLHSLGSDRSSSPICATCCSASLARSLTALTVGDSSVWPCPRCFSSRGAALQRYVGQAACRRRRFHRRRREERWREKEGETAHAPRHARALSCQSWRGEWAYPLARSLVLPTTYLPAHVPMPILPMAIEQSLLCRRSTPHG